MDKLPASNSSTPHTSLFIPRGALEGITTIAQQRITENTYDLRRRFRPQRQWRRRRSVHIAHDGCQSSLWSGHLLFARAGLAAGAIVLDVGPRALRTCVEKHSHGETRSRQTHGSYLQAMAYTRACEPLIRQVITNTQANAR